MELIRLQLSTVAVRLFDGFVASTVLTVTWNRSYHRCPNIDPFQNRTIHYATHKICPPMLVLTLPMTLTLEKIENDYQFKRCLMIQSCCRMNVEIMKNTHHYLRRIDRLNRQQINCSVGHQHRLNSQLLLSTNLGIPLTVK